METQNIYPKPSKDGFCFLSEEDELMSIESITYENKKEAKRIILSDGRTAIVRELTALETEQSNRLTKNDKDGGEGALMALASIALKVDDKPITYDEVKFMKARDWVKIKTAVARLNF